MAHETGFYGVNLSIPTLAIMTKILNRAKKITHNVRLRSGRTACNVLRFLSPKLKKEILSALREEKGVVRTLRACLGDNVALANIQHIVCPSNTLRQDLHRDVSGVRKAASLAVSLSDIPMKTWFLPGSHLTDGDLVVERANDADLLQPLFRCVIHDMAIVHCGDATLDAVDDARLFFTFVNFDMPTTVLRDVLRRCASGGPRVSATLRDRIICCANE